MTKEENDVISNEEHARRMELYRAGLSDKKIAGQLGRAACTVGNWRARNGLKPHYRKYGGRYVAQD